MSRSTKRPAMIHVWHSNQLERLANRLIENLDVGHESVTRRLFLMPPVIVPNQNIETYLKYEVARQAGIAAGLKFQVTESFLAELITSDGTRFLCAAEPRLQATGLTFLARNNVGESQPRGPCQRPCSPLSHGAAGD